MEAIKDQPGSGENQTAQQEEMPFAIVQGQPYTQLPKDLYIPPDALEVFLEAFEGPLDLLLYLIRRQNLDILDIPIAEITKQYMEYIEMIHDMQARTGCRIPGDGRHACRNQITHAVAAPCRSRG